MARGVISTTSSIEYPANEREIHSKLHILFSPTASRNNFTLVNFSVVVDKERGWLKRG
jgi:hypothetical protein